MKQRIIWGITKGTVPVARTEVAVAPKPRLLQGLPESEQGRGKRLLHSLVPDFPLPEVPEYLWGRSTTRRHMPVKETLYIMRATDKAYRVSRALFSTDPAAVASHWIPKSQVYVHLPTGSLPERTQPVDVWFPLWLWKEKFPDDFHASLRSGRMQQSVSRERHVS